LIDGGNLFAIVGNKLTKIIKARADGGLIADIGVQIMRLLREQIGPEDRLPVGDGAADLVHLGDDAVAVIDPLRRHGDAVQFVAEQQAEQEQRQNRDPA